MPRRVSRNGASGPIGERLQRSDAYSRNSRVRSISQKLAALCVELEMPYFDSHSALQTTGIWLRDIKEVDGTHHSAAGYEEWARLIENWSAWRDWVP